MPNQRPLLDVYGATDIGHKRDSNQDHFLVADVRAALITRQTNLPRMRRPGAAKLLMVADGMGGMARGAAASRTVIQTVMRDVAAALAWYAAEHPRSRARLADDMAGAAHRAKRALQDAAQLSPVMGTTLTVACLLWPELVVLHAGDSRCYVCNREGATQLTTDHTIAQRLVEEGALDEDAAESSPFAHVLWNSVSSSTQSELDPQSIHRELTPEDVVVLCSDGLTRHVSDARIAAVARRDTNAEAKVRELLELARDGGGMDNITVIVAQPAERLARGANGG